MLGIPHPYFTSSLPGVGGVIKRVPEDFIVEELPLYSPADEGEHTYFEIQKVDLSTPIALERVARELGVPPGDMGYAGLKDRKAVTRQVLSVAGVEPERVLALRVPQLEVLWARRHRNKLRVGHLRGNRFKIWVRGIDEGAEPRISECLAALLAQGIPNYYGPQRFGNRGDAHRIGRAFLQRDDRGAIRRILGCPSAAEHNPHVVRAREHFEAGQLDDALTAFPGSYRDERRLLAYLLQAGENYAGARRKLSQTSRKLFFTAYQSYLFNLVLVERLSKTGSDLSRLLTGDIAFLHRNGAVFRVEHEEAEQPRAAAFEISASGPIYGKKMPVPQGLEGEWEQALLEREGIRAADFHQLMPGLQLEGGRRPFRVRVEDLEWRLEGADLHLEFFLPKGSYATTLLREIMKNDVVPAGFYEDGEGEKHDLWRPPAPPGAALPTLAAELEADEPAA